MFTTEMKEEIHGSRAKDLINYLAIVIKTSKIHHVNNIAVVNVIHKLLEILNPLISFERITLHLMGEIFYLNGNRVRYTVEYSSNFDFIIEEFKKIELGTIVFKDELNEDDVKILVSAIKKSEFSETPFQTLTEEFNKIPQIEIEVLREIKEDPDYLNKKKQIRRTYSNAVSIIKEVLNKVKSSEGINLKKSKRVVETITDLIFEEESKSILMGLTTLKDYDDYTYYHSVNVSIFAIAFGQKLGFPKKDIVELGLAALLHDIGKIKIPLDILNKPTTLSSRDWEIIGQHPVWGAITILKIKGINDSSMNLAISAFEHHLNYDFSGYPKLKERISIDFYSNIIAIADQYDAITSSRVYSRTATSPDKALGLMIGKSGKELDPHLLKVFIQMIGVYPIGCLVMLNTNELGLVFENNSTPDFIDRPRVLIITDSLGARVENKVVDLMENDKEGNYKWTISKTLDPNQYGINLAEYLL